MRCSKIRTQKGEVYQFSKIRYDFTFLKQFFCQFSETFFLQGSIGLSMKELFWIL